MKIMNRLSRMFERHGQATKALQGNVLGASEIRLIAGGDLEQLASLAVSSRLQVTDLKGDTPLHIAARLGNLAACDRLIQLGADPAIRNHEGQTPADVAFEEGHELAGKLLASLVEVETTGEGQNSIQVETVAAFHDPALEGDILDVGEPETVAEDLDGLLTFEAESEAEDFFEQSAVDKASGTFVALTGSVVGSVDSTEGDWELDLSPGAVSGDGFSASVAAPVDQGEENDFLQVKSRGRKSVKRAVLQSSTRMSIDPAFCLSWAEDVLSEGRCSLDDIDRLIANCEGNGDIEELRINLQRHLEVAGFDFEPLNEHGFASWSVASDARSDELADAVEAALTRRTRLPGTQRFGLGKTDELQLLEPMIRAKQELKLGILYSEAAVDTILAVFDDIRDGSRDPASVSLKTIFPTRPEHGDTSEVMAAADALRSWHTSGRGMTGRRRREALNALEALDLSQAFHKELVRTLEKLPGCQAEAGQLEAELLVAEMATQQLIIEHLPYARRFASRNVEDGEDPEEVFQVAFIGLHSSTRRFDPKRGYRFLIYATYWMRQAITRWRADEGAAIRLPVHRNELFTKLDRVLERLDGRLGAPVSDLELADELEWTIDEVRLYREIPREAEYPESFDDWDDLLPQLTEMDVLEQADITRMVTEALAELPEREADIIRMRFGIGHESEMTLEEIGQIYGLTRERIRQIEKRGLERLSHPVRKRQLRQLFGM